MLPPLLPEICNGSLLLTTLGEDRLADEEDEMEKRRNHFLTGRSCNMFLINSTLAVRTIGCRQDVAQESTVDLKMGNSREVLFPLY